MYQRDTSSCHRLNGSRLFCLPTGSCWWPAFAGVLGNDLLLRCGVMGSPPRSPTSPLELLRLELALPPATKQSNAEKLLRMAVRQSAERQRLAAPPSGQLRQVQAAHGSVFALLGVPRADAQGWLRSSGFGGLLVRPFWVSDGSNNIQRSDYEVVWLRACSVDAAKLWESLSEQPGFFGVVPNG